MHNHVSSVQAKEGFFSKFTCEWNDILVLVVPFTVLFTSLLTLPDLYRAVSGWADVYKDDYVYVSAYHECFEEQERELNSLLAVVETKRQEQAIELGAAFKALTKTRDVEVAYTLKQEVTIPQIMKFALAEKGIEYGNIDSFIKRSEENERYSREVVQTFDKLVRATFVLVNLVARNHLERLKARAF